MKLTNADGTWKKEVLPFVVSLILIALCATVSFEVLPWEMY